MKLDYLGNKFRFISALCYDCTCDVYEYVYAKNDTAKVMEKSLSKVYEGIPCRISYDRFDSSMETEDANCLNVGIRLFWDGSQADIKEGSLIHVFKYGREEIFISAGKSAEYGSHSEVKLKVFKNRA